MNDENRNDNLDMTSFPEPQKPLAKKRKKEGATQLPKPAQAVSPKQSKKAKSLASTAKPQKKASVAANSRVSLPLPPSNKACIRCRERKIKCDKSAPTCNQCQRGLWTCQYEVLAKKKRSRNGCQNCKDRKRKCTEERPSCAHCLRLDDDCEYATYP